MPLKKGDIKIKIMFLPGSQKLSPAPSWQLSLQSQSPALTQFLSAFPTTSRARARRESQKQISMDSQCSEQTHTAKICPKYPWIPSSPSSSAHSRMNSCLSHCSQQHKTKRAPCSACPLCQLCSPRPKPPNRSPQKAAGVDLRGEPTL